MPFSKDVSCSSVHGSATMESYSVPGFDGASGWTGWPAVGVSWGFSVRDGVEAPCDGSLSFFLGGICTKLSRVENNPLSIKQNQTMSVPFQHASICYPLSMANLKWIKSWSVLLVERFVVSGLYYLSTFRNNYANYGLVASWIPIFTRVVATRTGRTKSR